MLKICSNIASSACIKRLIMLDIKKAEFRAILDLVDRDVMETGIP